MRRHSHHIALCLTVATLSSLLPAAENNIAGAAKMQGDSIDLFAGMDSGDLQVKLIPKNDREASLLITNKTKQPLSVVLPDAFVGAPILAQAAAAGGNRNRATTNNSNNNQNQTVGGGGGLGGGGGGIGGGGRGGGGFNVAPEAVGKIKLAVVCLEHGKLDPAAHIPYEIRPVESFSKDPQVKELLTMLGQGNLDQRAAQVAAWHFANGLSWDELAAKKIHHLDGRPDEPYFSRSEIQQAIRIGSQVMQLAKDLSPTDNSRSNGKPDSNSFAKFGHVSIARRKVILLKSSPNNANAGPLQNRRTSAGQRKSPPSTGATTGLGGPGLTAMEAYCADHG